MDSERELLKGNTPTLVLAVLNDGPLHGYGIAREIERRSDNSDRRVNRLYLRKAARPLLAKLGGLRSELTATALEGISPSDANRLLAQLEAIKENVRNAIQNAPLEPSGKEQRYG